MRALRCSPTPRDEQKRGQCRHSKRRCDINTTLSALSTMHIIVHRAFCRLNQELRLVASRMQVQNHQCLSNISYPDASEERGVLWLVAAASSEICAKMAMETSADISHRARRVLIGATCQTVQSCGKRHGTRLSYIGVTSACCKAKMRQSKDLSM